jgi:hypothetical protein
MRIIGKCFFRKIKLTFPSYFPNNFKYEIIDFVNNNFVNLFTIQPIRFSISSIQIKDQILKCDELNIPF